MKYIILALIALWTSGCAGDTKARHTLDEYRADSELRRTQLERCVKDPGSLRSTPDCVNAHAASAVEDRTSLREAPAVGLKDQNESSPKSRDPRLVE
jgi:hypothetical protein